MFKRKSPAWVYQGKTVGQVIEELNTFENKNLGVLISTDYGDNRTPVDFIDEKSDFYLIRGVKEEIEITDKKNHKQSNSINSIEQMIENLKILKNDNFEVRISVGSCDSNKPISLIGKRDGACLILSCSDFYDLKLG